MLTDSVDSELLHEEKAAVGPKLIAGLLALVFTAGVFGGYVYFRNRHARQNLAEAQSRAAAAANTPRGPAKAHILIDEAMLKGGQTTIGGLVKNISQETLAGLAVDLELKRRTGGALERMTVPLTPAKLEPNQEGSYVLKVPAQHFSAVKLVSLTSDPNATQLMFTTALGQKRPPERLEPKVVVVPRPPSKGGEFLNSPDNPARVP
ncbi:MAG TPA: hypothetical protein VJS64_06940 [Pyrinomonadaceae bacterium]|nr:hypothetical protein [Pyrinomonadaceae bacterium]